jgi:HEAT repeat protein
MISPFRTTLCSAALLLLAAAWPLYAITLEPSPGAPIATVTDDDSAYTAGTQAMNAHNWPGAVTAFDKVINAKGKRVDAALYWKAYSLNKLDKLQLASATCDQLRSQYLDSPWNRDCAALAPNIQIDTAELSKYAEETARKSAASVSAAMGSFSFDGNDAPPVRGSDDDLKMLALNSLLNQDPARAVPLLRGILTGNQSANVKKHALFVLAQSKSPEAESILHDAVTGKMDPQLQREAIQSMAVFQGKRADATLVEVYKTTSDPQIKRSVISGLFITQDASGMVELARNEKDLNLKRSIVSQLALMNDKAATDYMMELLK